METIRRGIKPNITANGSIPPRGCIQRGGIRQLVDHPAFMQRGEEGRFIDICHAIAIKPILKYLHQLSLSPNEFVRTGVSAVIPAQAGIPFPLLLGVRVK
jgi:hypothetical protein